MMTSSDREKRGFVPNRNAWRVAVAVAVVSGLFCLIVSVALLVNFVQVQRTKPLDNPELARLREQLAASPAPDEALAEQVRALDLLTRKAFFTSQAHARVGAKLLLAGAIIFVATFRLAARWNPNPPRPSDPGERARYWDTIAQSKELVTGTAVILVLAALTAGHLTRYEGASYSQTRETPTETAQTAVKADFPDWEEVQKQWPSFRGPGNLGVAHHTNAPTEWDGVSGEGIRWKMEPPLPGFNSPVVWDDRVFLSGASETVREVYCVAADTGELLWQSPLPAFPGTPEVPPKVGDDTGYAAPTMAVHGQRAFAMFGTGDLACFDFEGNLIWGKNLGVPQNHYGHSSSLIAHGNLLYVQFDDKANPRLLALDCATGDQVWSAQRTKISWASPACATTPFGMHLLLASEKQVDAYDPVSGALLWTQECLGGEVAPSPAYGGGIVFVANEYAIASAIRLTESGGSIQPEIVWEWDESLPDVSSPVGTSECFYIATSMGEVVCLAISSGEKLWSEEFDEGFYSSPILVGDRIYVLDRQGIMRIFKAAPVFEPIGSPALGEPTYATPAYLDGRIYVRTEDHLLCIE